MNNNFKYYFFLGLSALFSNPSFAAVQENSCPAEIVVAQNMTDGAPSGWQSSSSKESHPLINISFSWGAPSEKYIIAPSKTKKSKKSIISTWDFSGNNSESSKKENYWVSCEYSKTSVTVFTELHTKTKSCMAEYDNRFSVPVVKNWRCE